MIITNRSCQYPHRRRLVVQEIVVDNNNNIEELIVDEYKNEGVVYEEGTKLTAKNLELILNKYYVENLYGEWIQSEIECYRYFLIETAIPLEFILTNEAECYVNLNVIEQDDHHILIYATDTAASRELTGTGSIEFKFNIKLISNEQYLVNNDQENKKKIIADLDGTIKYYFSSESPLD